ncbi:putative protein OS=Streptomyces alboniger OX=132473 GN=CP975_05015 PE=4 SV=1 [Streptomyces alboniger]
MAPTRHDTMRRALRREVAGTIGLLADEEDFAAMRRYRTFTFDDHDTYLQQVESLLRTLAAQGRHTAVVLFDPEECAEYCAEKPASTPTPPTSRTRFTAELASGGPAIPYEGQPLTALLPDLVDEAVRKATWEYATMALARSGICTTCGEDIGRTAFTRASRLITRAVETSDPGTRHLVCSVPAENQTLLAALHIEIDADGSARLDDTEALEFATVLAVGIATRRAAGLVLRSSADGARDRVQGWRMPRGTLPAPSPRPRSSTRTAPTPSQEELISPESGVDYCAAPRLEDDLPEGGHTH